MSEYALKLIKSYLSFQSQCVEVGDQKSNFVWMHDGINNGCQHDNRVVFEGHLFGEFCKTCGASASYADNINLTIAEGKQENMLPRVKEILSENVTFCNANYLKINNDKTELARITTRQQHQVNLAEMVVLYVVDENSNWLQLKDT